MGKYIYCNLSKILNIVLVINDKYSYSYTLHRLHHIYIDFKNQHKPTYRVWPFDLKRPQIGRVWEHLRERRGRFLHAEGKASNVKLLKECLKTVEITVMLTLNWRIWGGPPRPCDLVGPAGLWIRGRHYIIIPTPSNIGMCPSSHNHGSM